MFLIGWGWLGRGREVLGDSELRRMILRVTSLGGAPWNWKTVAAAVIFMSGDRPCQGPSRTPRRLFWPGADPSLQFWVLHELPAVFGALSLVNLVSIHCHEEYTVHDPR